MRKYVSKNLIWLALLLVGNVFGQVDLDLDVGFLTRQLKSQQASETFRLERHETNEIKMGVQLFFVIYKNYFSSQDNRNCAFAPSCSTYCLHSIQKKGVVRGLMGAFDRLSRCNYLSPENYRINLENGQLLDPVE